MSHTQTLSARSSLTKRLGEGAEGQAPQVTNEHIVLEPGDLFPPFSPPPSPRGEVKKGPQSPQQHRLFRVLETPVIDNIRWGRCAVPQPLPPEPPPVSREPAMATGRSLVRTRAP